MTAELYAMRVLVLTAFALVAALSAPGVGRIILARTHRPLDEARSIFFFLSLLIIGFQGRWLWAAQSDGTLLLLCALAFGLAVLILHTLYVWSRERV